MSTMKNIIYLLLLIFYSSTIAQQGKIFDVKVGTSIPIIKFGELYTPGFSSSIGYLYSFSNSTQVSLRTGFSVIPFDNEKYNAKNADFENGESFGLEAPIKIIPFSLGIRYLLSDKKIKPYFEGAIGFYYYYQKLTGTYIQNGQIVNAPEMKESAFSTMFNLGLGFIYPLSEDIDFDFSGKFNGYINANAVSSNGQSSSVKSSSRTLYSISILAGINVHLD